jgi:hypothetical protein
MLVRNGSFGEPEVTPQKGAIGMFSRNPMNGYDPPRERTNGVRWPNRGSGIWPAEHLHFAGAMIVAPASTLLIQALGQKLAG